MKAMKNWDVLAIAGPSGVGKSRVSYPLARHFGVSVSEVDDLFHAIEAVTTPTQLPAIHYFQTYPEARYFSAERIFNHFLDVCRALSPAIASVIDNHIETRVPVVLDGDYILPELIARCSGRVKAIFLFEEDEDQLLNNYLSREPDEGEQRKRAQISRMFGDWLRSECERLGLIAIPARPWETVLDRVIAEAGV